MATRQAILSATCAQQAGSNQAGQGSVEEGGGAPVERSSRSNSKDEKKDRNLDAVKNSMQQNTELHTEGRDQGPTTTAQQI
ncbi:hypothetical protein ACOMHN_032296 [Nucella lapillus]